jgi:hypothetical protein
MLIRDAMAWWEGLDGVKRYYWDGWRNPLDHACACNSTRTCISDHVTCNCDQNTPQWLMDQGVLTDPNALPVRKLSFGRLQYEGQQAYFKLGPLTCGVKE